MVASTNALRRSEVAVTQAETTPVDRTNSTVGMAAAAAGGAIVAGAAARALGGSWPVALAVAVPGAMLTALLGAPMGASIDRKPIETAIMGAGTSIIGGALGGAMMSGGGPLRLAAGIGFGALVGVLPFTAVVISNAVHD